MSVTALLAHRLARLLALVIAAAVGGAVGWPLGPLSAALLAIGFLVLVKLAMEASTDAATGARRSLRAAERAEEGLAQVADLERRLAEEREEGERRVARARAEAQDAVRTVERGITALGDDLNQVRSDLDAVRSGTERLERQLKQLRRAERQHAEAHVGDEALRTVADAIERVVRQWRHDNQLAPQGPYGPPEARLAEALAALRERLDLGPGGTGAEEAGSAGLTVDERPG